MIRKLLVHSVDGGLVMLNTDKIDAMYDYVPSDDSWDDKESCTKIHMGKTVWSVQESVGQIDVMLTQNETHEE